MKKMFNVTLTILLIYFSFYYTNMVSDYIKNKDPLMLKIKSVEKKYYEEAINAKINNTTIIPGISGKMINTKESYSKMKKVGNFLENLLVFDYIKPTISIDNNLDKLIIKGNPKKKNVSILVKVNDINILKKILENKKSLNLNFILEDKFISNNFDYLKTINNNIVININNSNSKLVDYCYTYEIQKGNLCEDEFLKTVKPTLITHDYYYNTLKEIENGSILAYQLLNEKSISEFNILLTKIENLGYKIVTLDTLLTE